MAARINKTRLAFLFPENNPKKTAIDRNDFFQSRPLPVLAASESKLNFGPLTQRWISPGRRRSKITPITPVQNTSGMP
jgi:hypothetical protein